MAADYDPDSTDAAQSRWAWSPVAPWSMGAACPAVAGGLVSSRERIARCLAGCDQLPRLGPERSQSSTAHDVRAYMCAISRKHAQPARWGRRVAMYPAGRDFGASRPRPAPRRGRPASLSEAAGLLSRRDSAARGGRLRTVRCGWRVERHGCTSVHRAPSRGVGRARARPPP